jgi:SAM-dependent methyltransferase
MDQPNCLLCGAVASGRPWFIKTTAGTEYPIVRCAACKSAFVWPRPESQVISALYTSQVVQPNEKADGIYLPSAETDARRLFRRFSSSIAQGSLLDIGAGEGVASAEAVRRGFTVRACEPSPQGARLFAQRLGFEPDRTFFDVDYAEKNRGNFDVALLSHVLEHTPDPNSFVQNICTVLKPGGSVIVAVPLFGSILTSFMGKKDFFVTPPVHLTYFSLAGLAGLLNRNGFEVVASYTSSKVNMERYKTTLGPMRYAVNITGYLVLRASEMFHRSVVLNVCAKRT